MLSSPFDSCRRAFFTLVYELSKNKSLQNHTHLSALIKVSLLRGLIDPDENVCNGVHDLFSNEKLSKSALERFEELLRDCYAPQIEPTFLNTSCSLLLECSKFAPHYLSPLFESGLPNARFDVNQRINTSWNDNPATQPLFANSQSQNIANSSELNLRKTQSVKWAPTQEFSLEETRNIFSAASEVTASPPGSLEGFKGAATRAYPFLNRTPRMPFQPVDYAKQSERKKRALKKTQIFQRQARYLKVSLSRNYRIGELVGSLN